MNRNRPYIFRRTLLSLLIPSLIYSVQGRAYTQYVYDSVSDEFVTGQQTVRPGELRRITLFIVAVFNMLKAVPLLGVFCKGENRLYGRRERYMELSLRMAGHSV